MSASPELNATENDHSASQPSPWRPSGVQEAPGLASFVERTPAHLDTGNPRANDTASGAATGAAAALMSHWADHSQTAKPTGARVSSEVGSDTPAAADYMRSRASSTNSAAVSPPGAEGTVPASWDLGGWTAFARQQGGEEPHGRGAAGKEGSGGAAPLQHAGQGPTANQLPGPLGADPGPQAVSTRYLDIQRDGTALGFTVTSTTGDTHNAGSLHAQGLAVDFSVRGKTDDEVTAFIGAMEKQGYHVRDERTRPPGQAVWSAPHIHVSADP